MIVAGGIKLHPKACGALLKHLALEKQGSTLAGLSQYKNEKLDEARSSSGDADNVVHTFSICCFNISIACQQWHWHLQSLY